jgi:hypothetical protein
MTQMPSAALQRFCSAARIAATSSCLHVGKPPGFGNLLVVLQFIPQYALANELTAAIKCLLVGRGGS